ncbi:MAG: SIS domain-containing protein [Clostridia bacterium]|nr:SIS domain-containing protein [Clostridia bacterium]
MKQTSKNILNQLQARYPALTECIPDIEKAAELICEGYRKGGKLLICGNGGSASDALHIVGELMKSFVLCRPVDDKTQDAIRAVAGEDAELLCNNLQGALPTIALVSESALTTAYSNDVAPDLIFAQQVLGYGCPNDVLLGISTSGNSRNVALAAKVARAKGLKVISLTGMGGGKLFSLSDVTVAVPLRETYQIQELHLPVYHALCLIVEEEFFGATEGA